MKTFLFLMASIFFAVNSWGQLDKEVQARYGAEIQNSKLPKNFYLETWENQWRWVEIDGGITNSSVRIYDTKSNAVHAAWKNYHYRITYYENYKKMEEQKIWKIE